MRETELVFQQASLCKSCLSLVRSPFLCRYLQNCYRDLGKTNKVLVTVYKLYVLFNAPRTRIRTFWKPHILETAFFLNRIQCPDLSLVSCEREADMRFQKYPDSCGRGLRVEEELLLITSQLCFKMNFYLITHICENTPDSHSRNTRF